MSFQRLLEKRSRKAREILKLGKPVIHIFEGLHLQVGQLGEVNFPVKSARWGHRGEAVRNAKRDSQSKVRMNIARQKLEYFHGTTH